MVGVWKLAAIISRPMDITTEISKYINSKNESIWNEVKNKYVFKFTYDPFESSWMSKSENGIAFIVTNNRDISFESFTHELLHIYLNHLGLSELSELIYGIKGENSFEILLEEGLVPFIYNVCSHKKMFPYYTEMGFSDSKFVEEGINFSVHDLSFIENSFSSNGSKLICINQFIGHSLALLNNVVEADKPKCNSFLIQLRSMQPALYNIIETFDLKWKNSLDLNLTPIFLDFEDDLEKWLVENNFTVNNNYSG